VSMIRFLCKQLSWKLAEIVTSENWKSCTKLHYSHRILLK